MPVVNLQISCKIPEDEGYLYEVQNAKSFASIVVDLAQYLRDRIKDNADLGDEEMKAYCDIQATLLDLLSEYGVTVDY